MKKIIRILALVLMASCREGNQKGDLVFSSDKDIHKLISIQVSRVNQTLELKPLNYKDEESSYRLTVINAQINEPYSVEFKSKDDSNRSIVRTSHNSNLLLEKVASEIDEDSLIYYLNQLDLETINNLVNTCEMGDGTIYVFEFANRRMSKTIVRWSPEACKVDKSNEFMNLVFYIVRSSGITNSEMWNL